MAVVVPSPREVVGLLRSLAHQPRARVLHGVRELNLLRDRDAVVHDLGGAVLRLEDDVAALGAERDADDVRELVHAPLHLLERGAVVGVEVELLRRRLGREGRAGGPRAGNAEEAERKEWGGGGEGRRQRGEVRARLGGGGGGTAGPEGRRRIVRSWKGLRRNGVEASRAGRPDDARGAPASAPTGAFERGERSRRGGDAGFVQASGRSRGSSTRGRHAPFRLERISSSARRARPWAADGGRRMASVAGTPEGDASARAREKTRHRGGTWCRAFGSPRLGGVGTRRSRPRARTPDVSRRSIRRSARERVSGFWCVAGFPARRGSATLPGPRVRVETHLVFMVVDSMAAMFDARTVPWRKRRGRMCPFDGLPPLRDALFGGGDVDNMIYGIAKSND